MSVTAEALEAFGRKITSWKLIPTDGGRFEVTVNGELVYSKKETGRHVEPGEVNALLQEKIVE